MENIDATLNESITQCYAAFARKLSTYIFFIVKDRHVSEELVHDLFLRVFERRIELDPKTPESKWYLFKMARNIAYDHLRKKNKNDARFEDMVLEEICLNDQFYRDVESAYVEGEVISTLRDSILALPEKNRDVITLRGLADMRVCEVVRETNLSKYRVSRIEKETLGMLRSKIEKLLGNWRVSVRRPPVREWKT
ncbi:MAG TPA: sigma-70 family RNA polymerase sigma factor [Spirochaetota bacterium]|nr:sigma-70 family RNA polymerase sigma factor [Spirochaetota bacterium]